MVVGVWVGERESVCVCVRVLMAQDIEELKPHMKKVMPFVAFVKTEVEAKGPRALETTLPFDELQLLQVCWALLPRVEGFVFFAGSRPVFVAWLCSHLL